MLKGSSIGIVFGSLKSGEYPTHVLSLHCKPVGIRLIWLNEAINESSRIVSKSDEASSE